MYLYAPGLLKSGAIVTLHRSITRIRRCSVSWLKLFFFKVAVQACHTGTT